MVDSFNTLVPNPDFFSRIFSLRFWKFCSEDDFLWSNLQRTEKNLLFHLCKKQLGSSKQQILGSVGWQRGKISKIQTLEERPNESERILLKLVPIKQDVIKLSLSTGTWEIFDGSDYVFILPSTLS